MVDAGDPVTTFEEANGLINLWVDNDLVGSWKDRWLRTDRKVELNHFWLGLFHHREHSEAGLLFDNVIVSQSRIGCL